MKIEIENVWVNDDTVYYKSIKEDGKYFVEINSVEDLIDIMEDTKCPIILLRDYNGGIGKIEIYDDYRE